MIFVLFYIEIKETIILFIDNQCLFNRVHVWRKIIFKNVFFDFQLNIKMKKYILIALMRVNEKEIVLLYSI